MSNKTNSCRDNNVFVSTDNHDVSRKNGIQTIDEKYRDQYTGLFLDLGRYLFNIIKENIGDYKVINEDKNLSSVDKALGKRKVEAADFGLCMLVAGGILGYGFLSKKVFAA